jgi:hypothetical protein
MSIRSLKSYRISWAFKKWWNDFYFKIKNKLINLKQKLNFDLSLKNKKYWKKWNWSPIKRKINLWKRFWSEIKNFGIWNKGTWTENSVKKKWLANSYWKA